MTTQRDSFDERLTRLEAEVVDIKTLLGESAAVQAQILNVLNQLSGRMDALDRRMDTLDGRMDVLDRRMDVLDRRMDVLDGRVGTMDGRIEDIARHLGVPRRNGAA